MSVRCSDIERTDLIYIYSNGCAKSKGKLQFKPEVIGNDCQLYNLGGTSFYSFFVKRISTYKKKKLIAIQIICTWFSSA